MSGDDVTVGMATETDKQILDRVVEDFEKNFKENFKMWARVCSRTQVIMCVQRKSLLVPRQKFVQ